MGIYYFKISWHDIGLPIIMTATEARRLAGAELLLLRVKYQSSVGILALISGYSWQWLVAVYILWRRLHSGQF